MPIPREMLQLFCNWISEFYGTKVIVYSEAKRGEHARFMLKDSLFVIREFSDVVGTAVEVWSSDLQKLEEVERSFVRALRDVVGEKKDDDAGSK